jgi:hypothetical protein
MNSSESKPIFGLSKPAAAKMSTMPSGTIPLESACLIVILFQHLFASL